MSRIEYIEFKGERIFVPPTDFEMQAIEFASILVKGKNLGDKNLIDEKKILEVIRRYPQSR